MQVPAGQLADRGKCDGCDAPRPPDSEPIDVDDALFEEIVRCARVPILVDFWAEWCGPSRTVAPEVAEAARNMAGQALVLKVDAEKHRALASRFGVVAIPSFLVVRQGRVLLRQAGLFDHAHMEAWLRSAA